ncbi:MAG TPA: nicotinate-nucleotide--dimethylbenzimidazole phosphoribosyltransferase [Dehalococcoidia bacterium]|nr:nicotinate-nucleotide--dimethylbenzimidazole phosphoribosyltransferase [Dehalococcoidia bacterium]
MDEHRRTIDAAAAAIRPPDAAARDAARALQLRLTKPAGALARLEDLHVWAAGVLRDATPAPPRKLIAVAAADHGVAIEGVSAYPQDVTAQMVANFLAGGAAVNVLASHAGALVRVVDAGVRGKLTDARLHVARTRGGTDSMTRGPAMSRDEAATLVARGVEFARAAAAEGFGAIALGDMGIGNTTAAAAVTAVLAGAPPRVTTGRGTGVDDAAYARKLAAVERAIAINAPDAADAIDVLAKVGGFEIAFLAGVAIGAAASGAILVLDGYPTTAAALVAAGVAPPSVDYMLTSHQSAEPGHRVALQHLGLRPLLDLEMRLGEGTGAALAMTLLDAALRIPREMATFDSAGVSHGDHETQPEA